MLNPMGMGGAFSTERQRPRGDGNGPGSEADRFLSASGGASPLAAGGQILSPAANEAGAGGSLPVLHLLVVDEDDAVRSACAEIAVKQGFAVAVASDLTEAEGILKYRKVDLMLLDLNAASAARNNGGAGVSLLQEVKQMHPDTAVIVMTASASVASAVEAMRVGAADYLTKPFALEELVAILGRAAEGRQFDIESRRLKEKLRSQKGSGHLIGSSPEMEKLYRILSKVAHSNHPVLILGEAGTGKELVARSIHFNGPHAQHPFIPVDCGSLMPALMESELFGHVKGAFPGAHRAKDGLLASAHGGTVFLDEIGELPLDLQAKLLRALQERAVRPVGGTVAVPVSVRVLAATARDLNAMVEQGRFRKDLYYRLNVVNLRIPPLRDRKEDIPELAQYFMDRVQRETGGHHLFSDDALRVMVEYDWPGNVRELETAIEHACSVSSGPVVTMGDLPTQMKEFVRQNNDASANRKLAANPGLEAEGAILPIAEMERLAILGTIQQLKGDKLMAAKLLGIGKTTLYRKLKEYGMSEDEDGGGAEARNGV